MKIELNIKGLIIIIALIVGTFFLGRHLGLKAEEDALQKLSDRLKENVQSKDSYKIKVDSLTEYVNQVNTSITRSESAIKGLKEENKRLKALRIDDARVIATLESSVEVLNKELESIEPFVIIENECDSLDMSSYLKLPIELSYEDQWAYNNVSIDTTGYSLTNFGVYPSTVKMYLGTQKESIFQRKTNVTAITTPNPYLTIEPNQVIVVEPRPKWYQHKLFYMSLGLIGGYSLSLF